MIFGIEFQDENVGLGDASMLFSKKWSKLGSSTFNASSLTYTTSCWYYCCKKRPIVILGKEEAIEAMKIKLKVESRALQMPLYEFEVGCPSIQR